MHVILSLLFGRYDQAPRVPVASATGVLIVISMLMAVSAHAVTFRAPIDGTDWRLESSQFECRLSQAIPDFGTAVFEHRAGEELEFLLNAPQAVHFGRGTYLVAEAPPWGGGQAPRAIGLIPSRVTDNQLRVNSQYARDMLVSLSRGQFPALSNARWMGSSEPLKVAISAVNFQSAYAGYVACLAGLLPVNFNQIARSAVLFPSAEWRLSDATKKRLDLIALYVKNDSAVQSIFVDGHSDNVGRRLINRDLSRQRAEEVTRYLARAGISDEMITTRYHGERYPVVKNKNPNSRLRNRRVTVRLEKTRDEP